MNNFQIAMLVGAALLGLNVLWPQIKSLASLVKLKPKTQKTHSTDLVEIISCWENLRDSCQESQLTQASQELDKIFPLFVVKGGGGKK